MKILLLEDERMLRSSIKEYLGMLQNEVDDFSDGTSALEALRAREYDLFLLDIGVPEKSGFEVMEEIRAQKINRPVIFITASTEIEEIARAYELGCADYLKKPFKLQELWLRVTQIFRLLGISESDTVKLSRHYRYDKKRKVLILDGDIQPLTPKHQAIIDLLVENIGYCVDLERFKDAVWHRPDVDEATIRAEVGRVRKLLKDDLIQNTKGLGYKIEKPR